MDVLFFCNKLIGSDIRFLCHQECYVLIMAAYLHDIGMGVPKEDFAVLNTAYLAAIIRLADEIDVGAGRNSELLFDSDSVTKQVDIDAFGTHESIRDVVVEEHRIVLCSFI